MLFLTPHKLTRSKELDEILQDFCRGTSYKDILISRGLG